MPIVIMNLLFCCVCQKQLAKSGSFSFCTCKPKNVLSVIHSINVKKIKYDATQTCQIKFPLSMLPSVYNYKLCVE